MTWPTFWHLLKIQKIFTIIDNFYNFLTNLAILTIIDSFWQLRQFLTILTIEKTVLKTCDIWDTDYNSDNWEPEFMTIIVLPDNQLWHWAAFAILAMFNEVVLSLSRGLLLLKWPSFFWKKMQPPRFLGICFGFVSYLSWVLTSPTLPSSALSLGACKI